MWIIHMEPCWENQILTWYLPLVFVLPEADSGISLGSGAGKTVSCNLGGRPHRPREGSLLKRPVEIETMFAGVCYYSWYPGWRLWLVLATW